MDKFDYYKRSQIAELREVTDEDVLSFKEQGFIFTLSEKDNAPIRVSISQEDLKSGSPRKGDMIGRNPANHDDQWLIAEEYFKKNFEISTPCKEDSKPLTNFNIGEAISYAKKGLKIARKGWNGSGMFVYYVPASTFAALTETAKKAFGSTVQYNAYLAIKTANGTVSTWAPSGSDTLAEDWIIVD